MTTILVTGGAGFIGSNFIHYMRAHRPDCRLVNLDKLTYAGNLGNLRGLENDPGYVFVHGDICDAALVERVFAEHKIERVVNFAAESHVDRSIREPEVFVRINVLGTAVLLDAARRHWASGEGFRPGCRFLQVSTDEVYGSLGETGYFTEETPLDPHSPYSASKAGADLLAGSYHDTYGLPVNITRCSNNYGPFQFPEKLIPLMINNALRKKTLPVYGDGLNVRDWLYVEDHCAALALVLEGGRDGRVYNIGGHNERTNIRIVRAVLECLGAEVDPGIDERLIQYVTDRKGHDRRYAIDASRIGAELGWSPQTPFEDGLRRTIRWYLEHREWLDEVTSGEYQRYYERMYGE